MNGMKYMCNESSNEGRFKMLDQNTSFLLATRRRLLCQIVVDF
jgi:hypothetical protein